MVVISSHGSYQFSYWKECVLTHKYTVITNDLQMVPWQAKLMVYSCPNAYLRSHKHGSLSKCA